MGFLQAGFRPVAAYDNWAAAVQNYQANIGSECHELDLSINDIPQHDCDVLISGSPCQGFSTAGKRLHDDPRNKLLRVAVVAAARIRPKIVVIENVPGVTFGSHKSYWVEAKEDLEKLGYSVVQIVLNAQDFGVPQARRRVMLIACSTVETLSINPEAQPLRTVADALANVASLRNQNPKILSDTSRDGIIARHIGAGQKLCDVRGGSSSVHTWDIPEVFGATTQFEKELLGAVMVLRRRNRVRNFGDGDPVDSSVLSSTLGRSVARTVSNLERKGYLKLTGTLVDLRNTFNGKYRRVDASAASLTVLTKFGEPKYFLHPSEHRGFTVREAARIQGFPDDFEFKGALRDQYKMIGNAVPPPLARALATSLYGILKRSPR